MNCEPKGSGSFIQMILDLLGSSAGPDFDNTMDKGFDLASKFVAGPDPLLLGV